MAGPIGSVCYTQASFCCTSLGGFCLLIKAAVFTVGVKLKNVVIDCCLNLLRSVGPIILGIACGLVVFLGNWVDCDILSISASGKVGVIFPVFWV
jgi:hypothetical protein